MIWYYMIRYYTIWYYMTWYNFVFLFYFYFLKLFYLYHNLYFWQCILRLFPHLSKEHVLCAKTRIKSAHAHLPASCQTSGFTFWIRGSSRNRSRTWRSRTLLFPIQMRVLQELSTSDVCPDMIISPSRARTSFVEQQLSRGLPPTYCAECFLSRCGNKNGNTSTRVQGEPCVCP